MQRQLIAKAVYQWLLWWARVWDSQCDDLMKISNMRVVSWVQEAKYDDWHAWELGSQENRN